MSKVQHDIQVLLPKVCIVHMKSAMIT